jgi:Zn-dependent protease
LAGPFAQFVILGIVLGVFFFSLATRTQLAEPVGILLFQLIGVNSVWPVLNLLPIWPLDGGRISRETFEWLMPEKGTATSLIVSMIVSGFFAIISLAAASGAILIPFFSGSIYMSLFFALFAVNNFQEWQMVRYRSRRPWENQPDE